MLAPTFCPNPCCAHADPALAALCRPRFFKHCGSFSTRVPGHPCIPRFRCRACQKTFSQRTISATYRQKKPQLNQRIWQCLSSGVSRRQTARAVGTTRGTVERRFLWLASQSQLLHEQALSSASLGSPFLPAQFDEMESFVRDRFHPVSLPVLILEGNYFIVDSRVASIRRKGTMTEGQKRAQASIEAIEGKRKNRSLQELQAMLGSLRTLSTPSDPRARAPVLGLTTDEKPVYGRLIEKVLGAQRSSTEEGRKNELPLRVRHRTYSGKLRRDEKNPLFPINHTNAEHRYHVSMLIRRSWCHAKKEEGLRRHLSIYRVYRNFRRWVTNRHRVTPAMELGLAERKLEGPELFRWDRRLTIAQLRSVGAVAVGA